MTDEELLVEVVLTRLDHPHLPLEEIVALVVRRMDEDVVLGLAARALASRDELRAAVFPAAVEQVMRVVLTLRGRVD
ncbi:hypothetical protein V5P93_003746 [Actinokineospora auranticolor]|uniref:Uncharacterized protein n=1 Tax=Actinokineospora auranticolor TaxID=155976 RepID=A0A2S6GJ95_9PSEU|nr:hypothetical protein [Actinokineospora auranticolor]PPK65308.1 hypothetical protein CLV40_115155 [Actinokineospora auranticolor]